MAGITLEQAQARLDAALLADDGTPGVKRVVYQGREITFQDVDQLLQYTDFWNKQVQMLSARKTGRGRVAVPRPRW